MLNVIIITPGFAVDENDSACLPFLQLYIKELASRSDIVITIITEQYPATENYAWHTIPVITLSKKEPGLISRLFKKQRLISTLKVLHAENTIHVLHNFWFSEPALRVNRFALDNNIRHITSFAGQDVLSSNKSLMRLRKYRGIITCASEFHKKTLQKNYPVEVNVIEWGIEKKDTVEHLKNIDLLFCGWMNGVKNYGQFVDIVNELKKKGRRIRAVMCGGGAGLNELKKTVEQLDLENEIEIKGLLPRQQVLDLMRQTKIFVHTSNFESFGLVLAEALACDCRVLAKPVGIAYNNDAITKCETTAQFVSGIENLPDSTAINNLSGKRTYLIKDTVNKFLDLYRAPQK